MAGMDIHSDNPEHGFQFPGEFEITAMGPAGSGLEEQICELLTQHGQRDKVVVGSFYERSLKHFREVCPGVATSAGPTSVRPATLALPNAEWIARRISRGGMQASLSSADCGSASGNWRPQSWALRISR